MAKTSEQKIADLEAKLARAKAEARRKRTRRLIQAGAFFEPFLSEWEALPETHRRNIATAIRARVAELAKSTPPASADNA